VEIGSNDGIMLQNFAEVGIRHLGVEPSVNVANVARDNGINTISEFFDEKLAKRILEEYGQADVILAANVMCHIPYLHAIIAGMKLLLKPDGILVFEDPYLGDVIENTTYDQIYDEHVFLFCASSIKHFLERHDMEIFDVEPQITHGGSMRYYISANGKRAVSSHLSRQLAKEEYLGLNKRQTYEQFAVRCDQARTDLMKLLEEIRGKGGRIVGYAATSKSTTIINFCGITNKHIDYICDTTPIKQGKFSPGAHIPILSHQMFKEHYPDYALLFAYNHEKEIMAKETEFIASGGKWIVYVPEIKIRD
jgi:methylation protein EvaC